jgi:hypothetical protein
MGQNDNGRKIEIRLDNGDFTYIPALMHVQKGECIYWACNDGPFAVSFPDRTPLGAVTIKSNPDKGTRPFQTDEQKIQEVPGGVYHYHVAVAGRGKGDGDRITQAEVHMDSGCPGIEIP